MNALSIHTKDRAALILAAVCMLAFSPRVTMAQGPTPASKSASQPQQEPSSQQQPQQPAPPPASSSTSGQAGSSSSSGKRGHGHANDFLLIGTVFNDKAYAFPGAHVRARRTTEKKFRWETYTNSRGEFALRVPQGEEYEIVVNAKGFADQGGSVSAKSGISEETVVYRMQPATGGKK
jgi:hypothetical protein